MWWDWGRFYWGRKEAAAQGIVVVFAWLSSQERHVRPYVTLYSSLGWNSLVCHAEFLTMFFPEKAASLANGVINELIKETKKKPLPIVFAAFSGGPKACMYKALQIIDGKSEGLLSSDERQQLRDCFCGQIYDSSPVDFTSDLGTRFVLHPSVMKLSNPPKVVSWVANAIASGLDTLFLDRFEAQRADYWQTLYSSVNVGPFLIFCSEDDQLAPFPIISNFALRLQELGGDVKVVKWDNSPHVGHYKIHRDDYSAAVTELVKKATTVYSHRIKQSAENPAGGCNDITRSIFDLHKAAMDSNESLRRVAVGPSDHFFLPSSVAYHETRSGAVQDEQKGAVFQLENPPGINAHGVLGKILFDVCVPKNIEGWDIKPVGYFNGRQSFTSRHGQFNPIKYLRRSRL